LDDTIVQFDAKKGEGNGFKFGPYKPASFLAAIRKAVDLFENADAWKKLIANGMKADFSWDRSAKRYVELYHAVIEKGPQGEAAKGAWQAEGKG
jgi:starch synthase